MWLPIYALACAFAHVYSTHTPKNATSGLPNVPLLHTTYKKSTLTFCRLCSLSSNRLAGCLLEEGSCPLLSQRHVCVCVLFHSHDVRRPCPSSFCGFSAECCCCCCTCCCWWRSLISSKIINARRRQRRWLHPTGHAEVSFGACVFCTYVRTCVVC